MNAIIALIIVNTIVELFVCKLSLWWFIALISRVLFCLRIVGATFKVKTLTIVEAVALAGVVLFEMIFHKGAIQWGKILAFAICGLLSCFLMWIDDLLYVYVIEDDED